VADLDIRQGDAQAMTLIFGTMFVFALLFWTTLSRIIELVLDWISSRQKHGI
jgi:hypothetical protein